MKTKYIFILILLSLLFSACHKHEILQEGDILFQDLDCGPVCDAIESTTNGYENDNISHCAIVIKEGENFFVIEAYGRVKKTPLKEFLDRSRDKNGNPKVIAGRLKKQYRKYIPKAIVKAFELIGKPYDEYFELNNGKYYCSELIYDIFLDKNNKHIFGLSKMTFKNPKTKKIDSIWKKYFLKLGIAVPEGELGCNPANYSRSDKIEIFHKYGELSKKSH